jgi:hypothetical protein
MTTPSERIAELQRVFMGMVRKQQEEEAKKQQEKLEPNNASN